MAPHVLAAETQWVPLLAMVGAIVSALVTAAFALRGVKDSGDQTASGVLRDDTLTALRDERLENTKLREQRDAAEARVAEVNERNAALRVENDELRRSLHREVHG